MATVRPLRIALDLPLRAGDAAFTFAAGAAAGAVRGAAVVVPFGRRLLPGIVLGEGAPRPGLRSVLASAGPGPAVLPAVVDLAERVADEYLSSIGEALTAAVPWDALWAGARLRVEDQNHDALPAPARAALDVLARRPVTLARAGRLLDLAGDALSALAESHALRLVWPEARPAAAPPDRASLGDAGPASRLDAAVREALAGGPRAVLLAGWNRTPAYLAGARRAREAGWPCVAAFASVDAASAFALTARTAGLEPILLHADLAPAARLAAWRAAMAAPRTLLVGTRSAVFAPVADPALVIVDDEDSSGHKEERAPRYLTGAVARMRTRERGVLVIGATTPSVTAYAGTRDGSLRLVALPSPRPRIGVVDLRHRADLGGAISRPLLEAVRRTVRGGGRAVLLTDRKGYAGGLHCGECGAILACPRCGVVMPYDRSRRRLRCRFCAQTAAAPHVCWRCGAARLLPVGAGSERLVALVRRLTPAVWRFDSDALGPGTDPDALLAPVRERGGVLVATALVLPWLSALRPDLVGIVAADRMLHRPEYRAAERALALLREAGIASRALVLVETADPGHPSIRAAAAPSLKPFYTEELTLREALGYPPFRSLVALRITARSPTAAEAVAERLSAGTIPGLEVLGPTQQPGAREGALQWQIVIKAADRAAARDLVRPLLLGAGVPRGARTSADVDPHDL